MNINRVDISGYLTRDAELRYTQAGTAVASFGIAVNDSRKNPQTGEWEDFPNFVDCVLFGNFAESTAPHLLKGKHACIAGKLHFNQWEKDGQRHSKLEVVVQTLDMPRSNAQQPQQQAQQQPTHSAPPRMQTPPPAEVYDEDIPF